MRKVWKVRKFGRFNRGKILGSGIEGTVRSKGTSSEDKPLSDSPGRNSLEGLWNV